MAFASRKIQQPPSVSRIVDHDSKLAMDWAAFFHALQQSAFNSSLSGPTADRPTSAIDGRWIGMPYFDTTLGNVVFLASVNPDVWVSAGGSVVTSWTYVDKTADESITNDNVLSNDSELFFSMSANTRYRFRISVFYDTGASGDFQYQIQGPAGLIRIRYEHHYIAPGTGAATFAINTNYGVTTSPLGSGGGGHIWMEAIVENGVNTGNLNFQWAQNTADPTATLVLRGSYIQWMQLS